MITDTKHANADIPNFEDLLPGMSSDVLNFLGEALEFSEHS